MKRETRNGYSTYFYFIFQYKKKEKKMLSNTVLFLFIEKRTREIETREKQET